MNKISNIGIFAVKRAYFDKKNIIVRSSVILSKYDKKFSTNINNHISKYNKNSFNVPNIIGTALVWSPIILIIFCGIFQNFDYRTLSWYNESVKCKCSECSNGR